ncbi:MAG: TadE/TadG family protein [Pirellulales bacterium]|nr:TadE/TadG family protein [Pirellulales bacterium]
MTMHPLLPGAGVSRRRPDERRGNVLILTALLSVILLGMVAFAVDVGYMAVVKTELQRSVDAGALAGAGVLVNGAEAANAEVLEFVNSNIVGGAGFNFAGNNNNNNQNQGGNGAGSGPNVTTLDDDIEITTGDWDPQTGQFTEVATLPSAVKVSVTRSGQPLFFGRIFGRDQFSVSAESIATYQPRDIMLVLDFSASMNDDSEFSSAGQFGKANIIANLFQIYTEMGSPHYGSMQWTPVSISSTNVTTVKTQLGIKNLAYPFPGGSWDDYVNYVMTSSVLNSVGYKKKYGYMTWINYLLEQRPKYSETPALVNVSAQPIAQLKAAVHLFADYLEELDSDDRLGFAIYNSTNGTGQLEKSLTADFQSVANTVQGRQAGHYDHYTNIGAGVYYGRQELAAHARLGAYKMIVLMTDGLANRPSNETQGRTYALQQAQAVADMHVPIFAISLGAGADVNLMQQIADMTGGKHFNVPGGQGVLQYEEQLLDTFESIAKSRPLKVVK